MKSQIQDLTDFIRRVSSLRSSSTNVDLYRGHADQGFLLKPSLFRNKDHRKDEKNIFRELISLHPTEFEQDKNVFEQLVRMQHFSLPTRLLDVTYNPLVALYFACSSHKEKDGEFIRLSVIKRRMRYFDSDTVSCVANLSNLTGNGRNELREVTTTEELCGTHAGKRLLQFIKAEKSYFLPEMKPAHLKGFIPVRPKQNNRRILAQQGAFILFGLTSELPDKSRHGIAVTRSLIPAKSKPKILKDLDRININASTLFPEVESAARYIMSKLVPVDGSVNATEI